MLICKDGHANESGGCCCPIHGNTCGHHREYDETIPPKGYETLAEYLHVQSAKEMTSQELITEIRGLFEEFFVLIRKL